MTEARWQQDASRRIAELIREIDICMLVTHADGSFRGRPMSNNGQVEYDGDSWFFTYRDTPKVDQIEADPRVELAYIATDRGTWVSIEGTAEVVEDEQRKRDLWGRDLGRWFDGGPDDDRIVLLKVTAGRIHAWADGEEFVGEPGRTMRTVGPKEDAMERARGS